MLILLQLVNFLLWMKSEQEIMSKHPHLPDQLTKKAPSNCVHNIPSFSTSKNDFLHTFLTNQITKQNPPRYFLALLSSFLLQRMVGNTLFVNEMFLHTGSPCNSRFCISRICNSRFFKTLTMSAVCKKSYSFSDKIAKIWLLLL